MGQGLVSSGVSPASLRPAGSPLGNVAGGEPAWRGFPFPGHQVQRRQPTLQLPGLLSCGLIPPHSVSKRSWVYPLCSPSYHFLEQVNQVILLRSCSSPPSCVLLEGFVSCWMPDERGCSQWVQLINSSSSWDHLSKGYFHPLQLAPEIFSWLCCNLLEH